MPARRLPGRGKIKSGIWNTFKVNQAKYNWATLLRGWARKHIAAITERKWNRNKANNDGYISYANWWVGGGTIYSHALIFRNNHLMIHQDQAVLKSIGIVCFVFKVGCFVYIWNTDMVRFSSLCEEQMPINNETPQRPQIKPDLESFKGGEGQKVSTNLLWPIPWWMKLVSVPFLQFVEIN